MMTAILRSCYATVSEQGTVLDVGCWGFRQAGIAAAIGKNGLRHSGVDYSEPEVLPPPGYDFRRADLNREAIPFGDDAFDLVVASHVLEHVVNPVELFGELARVCRPGGTLYIEAPSERSLWLPSMPFDREKFFSLSYFDDPTHIHRPWTPQALFRLARYYGLEPDKVGHLHGTLLKRLLFPFDLIMALLAKDGRLLESCCWGFVGWACYLVARKPCDMIGKPSFHYYIPERL